MMSENPNCYQRCLFAHQLMVYLNTRVKSLTVNDFAYILDRIEEIFNYFPDMRDQCTDYDNRTGIEIDPLGIIFEELSHSRSDLNGLKDLIVKVNRLFPIYLETLNSKLRLPDASHYQDNVFRNIIHIRDLVALGQKRAALLVIGRTIEEMLYAIGVKRKLNRPGVTITINNRRRRWDELMFRAMNEVLHRTPMSNRNGSPVTLPRDIKEEIDPLIIYRNDGAHKTERTQEIEENAISYLGIGFSVLRRLCSIHRQISEHSKIYRHNIVVTF